MWEECWPKGGENPAFVLGNWEQRKYDRKKTQHNIYHMKENVMMHTCESYDCRKYSFFKENDKDM